MEFDEMKKIWDSQNNEAMYVINEEALHNRIRVKKKSSQRLARVTEFVFIGSNLIAGSLILGKNIWTGEHIAFKYIAALFFYGIAVYVMFQLKLRKREELNFENTMMGDLEHALSNATFQVNLSAKMMNVVFPVVIIVSIASKWIGSGFSWMIPAIVFFFAFVYYAASWEHRCYVSKKRELEAIKRKLMEEPVV